MWSPRKAKKATNKCVDICDKENRSPNPTPSTSLAASCVNPEKDDFGSSWIPPRATFLTKRSGVPENVPGRRPPDDESSEDENDETQRARRQLTSKLDPSFDHYDPKFYCLRFTSSGKPYKKRSKPYSVFAANSWGYLRKKSTSEKTPSEASTNINRPTDRDDNQEDEELGLRTIAYPGLVNEKKDAIAKEMSEKRIFNKTVNEIFRERYYVELPYCSWCDFRPCMCYV